MALQRDGRIGTEHFITLPMVFIDFETTGDSLDEGGEVCEIGAVKIDQHSRHVLAELDIRLQVLNPCGKTEVELSYGGYNGFSFAEWREALAPEDGWRAFNDFMAGCVPWAYNVAFENNWTEAYFRKYQMKWKGDYHWHCLMTMASVSLLPDFRQGRVSKLSLSDIGSYLGLGEEPKPHRGIIGARYEHEVYKILEPRSHPTEPYK